MLDVNCHWTVDEALKVAEQVRPYDLLWFEEPIWPPEDFESLAQVRKHSVSIAPHCPYFGPGLLASMHITATLAEPTMIEYSFADLGANPLGDAIEVKDGHLSVPTGPGLGRDPDPEIIKRFSI